MNAECKRKIQNARSLDEMFNAIKDHYEIEKPLNSFMAQTAAEKIVNNMDLVIFFLGIKQRTQSTNNRRRI